MCIRDRDWTEMLQRLYTRWISNKGFSFSILDYNSDTEGGIKSVTLKVDGENAYGFLKGEKGVHRLVRISPYDSSNKRHTSFASVDVFPEIEEITDVEINPKDLRIDTFRSGGAGGQHVNKTDSAVRITHIPTGLTVSCQSERSQMFNKDTAMRQLVAKLLIIKQEENREKIEDIQGKYSQIDVYKRQVAMESFIISAVFSPINILYLVRIKSAIASSTVFPPIFKLFAIMISPFEITEISVFPAPISTTIVPEGSFIFTPQPIAAAIVCSKSTTLFAPASLTA